MALQQQPGLDASYAQNKILFVSNNFGASLTRVSVILSASVASYAFYASTIRLISAQRLAEQHQLDVHSALRRLQRLSHLYERRSIDRSCEVKVVAFEALITAAPFLLIVTTLGQSRAGAGLVLALLGASASLFYVARQLETRHRHRRTTTAKREGSISGDEQGDDTSALRSQSQYTWRSHALRNRSARPLQDTGVGSSGGAASHPRRTWESDDEEQELEELERLEGTRQRKKQAQSSSNSSTAENGPSSPTFRVSVESAADQAYSQAHPAESWVQPGERPEEARSPSPSSGLRWSKSRAERRGLGLGLGLGLVAGAASTTASTPQLSADLSSKQHDAFLTVYRAHMMLLTIICILAVDFPVFPRELGKCESWGFSIMDLGVGSFVFSLGVVSASAHLNQARKVSVSGRLRRDLLKSLPLLFLGLVRVISVKLTAYPEHVTEYGVHWSFFLTLASLPLLKSLVDIGRQVFGGRFSTWGLLIGAAHQAFLSLGALGAFVLDDGLDRTTSLVTANREGLVSLPGYLAILLLSIDLGMYILPRKDPYQAFRKVKLPAKDNISSARETDDEDEVSLEPISIPDDTVQRHVRVGSDGKIDLKALITGEKREQTKRMGSLVAILVSWAIVYWVLFTLSALSLSVFKVFHNGFEHDTVQGTDELAVSLQRAKDLGAGRLTLAISRRLANLPYILVVLALNASLLAALAGVYFGVLHDVRYAVPSTAEPKPRGRGAAAHDSGLCRSSSSSSTLLQDSPYDSDGPISKPFIGVANPQQILRSEEETLPMTPRLLHLINLHSLPLFLVANVLTGLVNLTIPTMHVTNSILALGILSVYIAANVSVALFLGEGQRGQWWRRALRGS